MAEDENEISLIERNWEKLPKWGKITLGIIGTIVVGSFSSPVWTYIIQPFLLFCTDKFFDMVFSISKTMEHMLFLDIARKSINQKVTDINFILCSTILAVEFIFIYFIFRTTSEGKKTLQIKENKETNIEKLENKIKILTKLLKLIAFLLIILLIAGFSLLIEESYVAQKQEEFNLKLTICEPYMNSHEIAVIKSDFVLIETKKDYNQIINKLNNILSKNKIKIASY